MFYLLIFLLLALFYIILPFLGFFIVGENRNTIRKKIVATRYLPFVESLEDLSLGEKTPGRYFGQIKHINETGLCFSDGKNFLTVNTENLNCYELKIDNLSKKKNLYKLTITGKGNKTRRIVIASPSGILLERYLIETGRYDELTALVRKLMEAAEV